MTGILFLLPVVYGSLLTLDQSAVGQRAWKVLSDEHGSSFLRIVTVPASVSSHFHALPGVSTDSCLTFLTAWKENPSRGFVTLLIPSSHRIRGPTA